MNHAAKKKLARGCAVFVFLFVLAFAYFAFQVSTRMSDAYSTPQPARTR